MRKDPSGKKNCLVSVADKDRKNTFFHFEMNSVWDNSDKHNALSSMITVVPFDPVLFIIHVEKWLFVFNVNPRHWNENLWDLREYYGSRNGRKFERLGFNPPIWMRYFLPQTPTFSAKCPCITQKRMLLPVRISEVLTLQTDYLYWTTEQRLERDRCLVLRFCNLRHAHAN